MSELPRDVDPALQAAGPANDDADPVRDLVTRELDSNVLLQYAFSKAARLSRAGQLTEAAQEYAKLGGAAGKREVRGLAYVLRAEMLLRDPPTVLDVPGARDALEQAQTLGAPVREWVFTLGMLALREDRLTEARQLLVRSFTAGHQPQEAAAYLTVVDARLGDREAAAQWLQLAREEGPAWRSPEAEIALRDPANPPAALRAAAAEHPDEFWLRLALARELTTAGDWEQVVDVTRALAADSSVPERFRASAALGAARTLLLRQGPDRVAEAMKLAGQARALAPKSLTVWEVLALGYCRQGRFRRAAAAARRISRTDAELPTPHYVRAWALAAGGNCARAQAALAEGVARDPQWPLRGEVEAAVAGCR